MQRKENILLLAVLNLSFIKLCECPLAHGGRINDFSGLQLQSIL